MFPTALRRQQFKVFDRAAKLAQRNRAALQHKPRADFLRDEIAHRTVERLAFITRDLDRTLELGAHSGHLLRTLTLVAQPVLDSADEVQAVEQCNADRALVALKIGELVMADSLAAMLARDEHLPAERPFPGKVTRVVVDEETFQHPALAVENHYDAVVSNLALHWINNLPAALANIHRVLKPDGLFMATLFGGDTLYELRTLLQLAELERRGGMSPRVSPLVRLDDIGSLMNRAGFSMLTIDTEDIVVGGYPDLVALCDDLQAMGEQNCLLLRSLVLPRDVLLAGGEIARALHGETNQDGSVTIPATFLVIFVIGWKKSETQPQPAPRGSANVSLKDVL